MAFAILAAALGAFLLAVGYACTWNPEIALWKKAVERKQAWARQLTVQHGSKTLIFGGSSCAFSIDGEQMIQKHGIPLVNMGLHAGMGATVIANFALSETRPGDTLIVALEPGLLMGDLTPSALGIQLSYSMGHPGWVRAPWVPQPIPVPSQLLMLRPGASNLIAMVGKAARKMPLYRYETSDIHASGWLTTADWRFQETMLRQAAGNLATPHPQEEAGGSDPGTAAPKLSPAGEKFFRALRNWAEANHVRVAYSLPWVFVPEKDRENVQRQNIDFIRQISAYVPVLRDPALGTCTDPRLFADTPLHLQAQGAALRTDSLAGQLSTWSVWTPDELNQQAHTASIQQP